MYVRTIEEKDLTFQVSGMLWQRSLVMRDLETSTLWSHLLGRAMAGKHKDFQLEMVPAAMTTWADWKKRHPETTVLAMSRTADRFLDSVWEKPHLFVFGIPLGNATSAPAVSIQKLQKESIVTVKTADASSLVVTHSRKGGSVQAFESRLANRQLTFTGDRRGKMKDSETGSKWDMISGTCLSGELKGQQLTEVPGTISFYRAWKMFFPDSITIK